MRVLVICGGGSGGRRGKFLVRKRDLDCGADIRHPTGDPQGSEACRGLTGRQFVNAPAERCWVRRTTLGERFVWYRGKDYALMGLYYVPRPGKRPLPFFVLRSMDGAGRAPVPVPLGSERWRLRLVSAGRLAACVLTAAVLIAPPPRFGSESYPSGPPPADRGALSTVPGAAVENRRMTLSRPASPRAGTDHRRGAITVAATTAGRTSVYTLSFGIFRDRLLAEAVAQRVRASGYRAIVSPVAAGVRVRGHRYPTRASAARMVRILRAIGLPAGLESSGAGRA